MLPESRNSGTGARRPLLSNDSEITFPLHRIAANESLPGNKLLNMFPRQRVHERRVTTDMKGRNLELDVLYAVRCR
jgi:hypothetical protein